MRQWIRPAEPIVVPPRFQAIMGWSAREYDNAAAPTYPCLIDEKHVVAQLYDMPNVPMAVWIDEAGRIVRPAEPAGATDGFRRMDRTTLQMPDDVAAAGRDARKRYVDAVRDWVARGSQSVYALSEDAARKRVAGPTAEDALAATHFRLGQYLFEQGQLDRAQRAFAEAARLAPDHWHYLRQRLELQETGLASGPAFATAVAALGDRRYYPPLVLEET